MRLVVALTHARVKFLISRTYELCRMYCIDMYAYVHHVLVATLAYKQDLNAFFFPIDFDPSLLSQSVDFHHQPLILKPR